MKDEDEEPLEDPDEDPEEDEELDPLDPLGRSKTIGTTTATTIAATFHLLSTGFTYDLTYDDTSNHPSPWKFCRSSRTVYY